MIKKFSLLLMIGIASCTFVMAQSGAIGFHATVSEYDGDLNGNQHHFYDFKFNQVGTAISLQQYLNPSFNLVEKISFN